MRAEQPLDDAADRIELPACIDAATGYFFGGELYGVERQVVVAVVLVEPPLFEAQSPLGCELFIQRRTGERGQVVERGDVELLPHGEGDRLVERGGRIAVVAEDERRVDTDVVAAQVGQGVFIAAVHRIETLVHLFEVLLIEAFESDQHSLAAAGVEQLQQLLVVGAVDAHLRDPANLQRDERAQQRLGLFRVADEVVIDEEEDLFFVLEGPDLLDDVVDGPVAVGTVEKGLDRAEFARIAAAAPRFDQTDGKVALALEDGAVQP